MSQPSRSLARRALPALVLTGTSVALLTQLDAPASSSAAPLGQDEVGPDAGAPGADATSPSAPGPTAPTPTAPQPVTTVAATPAACAGQPLAGPMVETRWGPVQVAALLDASGGLCDVEATLYPSMDRKSLRINQRALPILHDRAVAARGAGFQAVSGATVTSEGYRASLQALLDGA